MSQLPVSSTGAGALTVALDAALRAGDIVKDRFYSQKEVRFKSPSDPVTDVDLAAEKAATDFLAKEYPAFGFICEESEPVNPDAEYRWIIDPIDGTRNYVMGIPHVAVSIGLADRSGIAAGVIYDPIRGEIFTAERGAGAHLNGEPVSVSAKTGLDGCLVGFDMGSTDREALSRPGSGQRNMVPGPERAPYGMQHVGAGLRGLRTPGPLLPPPPLPMGPGGWPTDGVGGGRSPQGPVRQSYDL